MLKEEGEVPEERPHRPAALEPTGGGPRPERKDGHPTVANHAPDEPNVLEERDVLEPAQRLEASHGKGQSLIAEGEGTDPIAEIGQRLEEPIHRAR
jgi:hypothetical protein